MAEEPLYTHHLSGRRPLTLFAALFAAAMVAFGLWKDAQWYAMVPMWAGLIMVGWLLVTNPQSGATLTQRSFRFYHGRQDRTIAVADIASVQKHIWSEGPDEITLILNDGEAVILPSQSIDRNLIAALEAAGVPRA